MAFTKYFMRMIKQEGPNQRNEVLVPVGSSLEVDSDGNFAAVLTVDNFPEGTVEETSIADAAVTEDKVADNSIGEGKIKSNAVTTGKIADANVTPAKHNIVQARTATDAGDGTGVIAATASHVTVTSSSAAKIITLPTPTPGRRLIIDVGANGFELASSAPATVAINGGAGSNFSSAVAANSTVDIICISATAWKAVFWDADGDVAKLPAAD